jgi:site-specific recombinase XerD
MISDYFTMPSHVAQIRSTCVGAHLDGFTETLAARGYSTIGVRRFIRPVAHFGRWAERAGACIESWDEETLHRFQAHLRRCTCEPNRGVFRHAVEHVEQFFGYLRTQAVIVPALPIVPAQRFSALSEQFADWMRCHRGVTTGTLHVYQSVLRPFLVKLGEQPERYTAGGVRTFVVGHIGRLGRAQAHSTVTGIRAFLRFLVATGRVPAGLVLCVPKVPQWRLASLPRYLEDADVRRVVDSCNLKSSCGMRDHAILLLLSRLGLRAGDIVAMEFDDVDWRRSTLRVCGKGRREVLLPLPQDVGEAVLAYLQHGRPIAASSRLFLTTQAPIGPFESSSAVSSLVRAALERAGIANPPSHGAHLLRHSAATAMLRAGGSLDTIAAVLRHQSSDTTMHYAKVDLGLLKRVAQPWPGRAAC